MAIVSGCDRDRVDLRITEDFRSVRCSTTESIAPCKRLCVHSPSGADRHKAQVLKRVEMREKHRFGIVAGSDHAKPDRSKWGIAGKADSPRLAFRGVSFSIGILKHDADSAV